MIHKFSNNKPSFESWKEVVLFFHNLELKVEVDYKEGKIIKKEKNKLQRIITKSWLESSFANNPFIEQMQLPKEITSYFLQRCDCV